MRFDIFQISVVDGGADLFRAELTHEERNSIARDAVVRRPAGLYWNQRYHLGNIEEETGAVWGRIIKPSVTDVGILDENTGDVADAEVDSAAWTHFVYLIEEQAFAVARKPEFFGGKRSGMAKLLEIVLNSKLSEETYSIRVIAKSQKQQFWDIVNSGKVTHLRLEFVPPNAFRSQGPLSDLLKTLREKHGAMRVGYDLSNPHHGLKIEATDESIAEEVSYVAMGGGRWRLKYKDDHGDSITARSDEAELDVSVQYQENDLRDHHIRSDILMVIQKIIEQMR